MKQVKKADLIAMIEEAKAKNALYLECCQGIDNPQVVELATRSEAKLEIINDILRALTHGELYGLRVEASGHIGVKGN